MTGFSQQRMALWQLKAKYTEIGRDTAENSWKDQHENAQKYCPGIRFKEYKIMAGLIMPVWGIVSDALQNARLRRDRQLRIFRVKTSDELFRFVGLYVPEDVKDNLLHDITQATGFVPRDAENCQMHKQIVLQNNKSNDDNQDQQLISDQDRDEATITGELVSNGAIMVNNQVNNNKQIITSGGEKSFSKNEIEIIEID
eukprot:TRINITY_DN1832_c0_g1_i1.p2 TRINITY_DN1832_c0_g1~~TRINITY_DN1832_c0_g1_i1.p2  ORF type:complete len:199 (+),score=30.35 TRINITY_DN1832_c0_g1_i1:171-767(+)